MISKKMAVCTSQCDIIKPGMVVNYEMYESYGNEWAVVKYDDLNKSLDLESFEKKFKIIN
jgi:hypothetical protein